jgi:uncharacterized protein YggE
MLEYRYVAGGISMKNALIAFLLLSTAATAAVAQTPSVPVSPLGPNSALLSVTAEGQSRRTPDLAIFSAGVVTQADTAGEAIAANSRRMNEVVAALKRAGIADRDVQTSSISLQPRYSNPELEAQLRARETRQPYIPPPQPAAPKIIGYEARNTLQVRVRRIGEMGKIIDTLIAQGANEVNGPSFGLDEPAAALDEARTEAMANARQRAQLYARAAGLRVVRILSITEGGGYYPMQEMKFDARVASAPPPPTPVAPGELTLGVNVSVQFELAP